MRAARAMFVAASALAIACGSEPGARTFGSLEVAPSEGAVEPPPAVAGGFVDVAPPSPSPAVVAAEPDAGIEASAPSPNPVGVECTTTRRVGTCEEETTIERPVFWLVPRAFPGEPFPDPAGAISSDSAGLADLQNLSPRDALDFPFFAAVDLLARTRYAGVFEGGGQRESATRAGRVVSVLVDAVRGGSLPPGCAVPAVRVRCAGTTELR